MSDFDMKDIILHIETDGPKIQEISEHSYECSACGTIVEVDPYLIHHYEEIYNRSYWHMKYTNYWHTKYPYSIETSPGYWVTFCRRVCEIKYYRQDEDLELPPNKR